MYGGLNFGSPDLSPVGKIERDLLVVAGDREDFLEDRLQARITWRLLGATRPLWRKLRYRNQIWTSMRFGGSMISWISPNEMRSDVSGGGWELSEQGGENARLSVKEQNFRPTTSGGGMAENPISTRRADQRSTPAGNLRGKISARADLQTTKLKSQETGAKTK